MTPMKFITMVLAYIVLTMAIAFPWHMVWFHDLYLEMNAFTRAQPVMPLGMLSMVIQGSIIAYLYPLFYRGGTPIIQGIKFGLIMGLVVFSVMGLAFAAKMEINPISQYLLGAVLDT